MMLNVFFMFSGLHVVYMSLTVIKALLLIIKRHNDQVCRD